MHFGTILKSVRESRNISQTIAARSLAVSYSTYAGVESGKLHPRYDILTGLSKIIGFTKEEYLALFYAKETALSDLSEEEKKLAE